MVLNWRAATASTRSSGRRNTPQNVAEVVRSDVSELSMARVRTKHGFNVVQTQMLDQLASELAVVKSTRQPAQAQVKPASLSEGVQSTSSLRLLVPNEFREYSTSWNCTLGLSMRGRKATVG